MTYSRLLFVFSEAAGEQSTLVTALATTATTTRVIGSGTLLLESAIDFTGKKIDFEDTVVKAAANIGATVGATTAGVAAVLFSEASARAQTQKLQWNGNIANNAARFNALDIRDDQNPFTNYEMVCLEHNGDFCRFIGNSEKITLSLRGSKLANGHILRLITLDGNVTSPDELTINLQTDLSNGLVLDYEGIQSSALFNFNCEGTTNATYAMRPGHACVDLRGSKAYVLSGQLRGLSQIAPIAQAFNCSTTNGSPTLTNVSSFTNLTPGMPVQGPSISSVAKIVSIDPGAGTVLLTNNVSATAANVAVTAFSDQSVIRIERNGVQPGTGEVVSGASAGGSDVVFNDLLIVQPTGTAINLVNPKSVSGQVTIRMASAVAGVSNSATVILQSVTSNTLPEGGADLAVILSDSTHAIGLQLGNNTAIANTSKKTLLAANLRVIGRMGANTRVSVLVDNAQDCVVDASGFKDGIIQFNTNALRNVVYVSAYWALNGGGVVIGGTNNKIVIRGVMTAAQITALTWKFSGLLCEAVSDQGMRPAIYNGTAWTYATMA